jgi:hypothetical protein
MNALFITSLLVATHANPVDVINARFKNGVASKKLASAGVLIHQFDDLEDESKPWEPCSIQAGTCWFKNPFDDRVSCSIVSNSRPKTQAGTIGLFSYAVGGVILSPPQVNMTCSYEGDGGTMTRVGGGCGCQNDTSPAPPPGKGPKCLEALPCDNKCDPAGPGPFSQCHQCAYGPDQLDEMLKADKHNIYNEILVASNAWMMNLPATIEAFFYVNDPACTPNLCQRKAIKTHSDFMSAYPQATAPLLILDPKNAAAGPFSCIAGC